MSKLVQMFLFSIFDNLGIHLRNQWLMFGGCIWAVNICQAIWAHLVAFNLLIYSVTQTWNDQVTDTGGVIPQGGGMEYTIIITQQVMQTAVLQRNHGCLTWWKWSHPWTSRWIAIMGVGGWGWGWGVGGGGWGVASSADVPEAYLQWRWGLGKHAVVFGSGREWLLPGPMLDRWWKMWKHSRRKKSPLSVTRRAYTEWDFFMDRRWFWRGNRHKVKKSSPVMTITHLQLLLKTQWGCEKTC